MFWMSAYFRPLSFCSLFCLERFRQKNELAINVSVDDPLACVWHGKFIALAEVAAE
jgi:hypothetical protein